MIFKDILMELRKMDTRLEQLQTTASTVCRGCLEMEKHMEAIRNGVDSIKDCGWREIKCVSQQGDTLQRMAESLAQLGEICATLKLTHDLDESLYMRAVKIHEQGENHGEILQQMADDLTLLGDEVVTIRGRMCERAETPAEDPAPEQPDERTREERRAQDRLLDGINNLLTYTPKVGGTDKED